MDKSKHDAIQEWQRGVGETTASENACFLDGFDAGRQAREAECEGLRRALTKILNAAESWHRETGHEDDEPIIKCDAICECIPIMRSALSGKGEGK